ncbi:hypothetical protein TREMEDRAFT_57172 [Tremella mesenterica DSM 1558]|nr:uncharacterized protein TREMEDRAFT_57172 [Tremella mesenterica DSM 1558]EIW68643.1 hypothetical protein TREMEDRAFT_57172 [Tremella mesenterica DSM 1558]
MTGRQFMPVAPEQALNIFDDPLVKWKPWTSLDNPVETNDTTAGRRGDDTSSRSNDH